MSSNQEDMIRVCIAASHCGRFSQCDYRSDRSRVVDRRFGRSSDWPRRRRSLSQPAAVEMAIREYCKSLGLEVVFFYPAPRAVKVTLRYGANAYWTIESVIPDHLPLSLDDTADWLYGNLRDIELPKVLPLLRRAS